LFVLEFTDRGPASGKTVRDIGQERW